MEAAPALLSASDFAFKGVLREQEIESNGLSERETLLPLTIQCFVYYS